MPRLHPCNRASPSVSHWDNGTDAHQAVATNYILVTPLRGGFPCAQIVRPEPNLVSPASNRFAAEIEAIVRELEELIARMEATTKESGTVSGEDSSRLRELHATIERLVGPR